MALYRSQYFRVTMKSMQRSLDRVTAVLSRSGPDFVIVDKSGWKAGARIAMAVLLGMRGSGRWLAYCRSDTSPANESHTGMG